MRIEDSPQTDQELISAFRRWFHDHVNFGLTAMAPSDVETHSLTTWWQQIVSLGWTSLRLREGMGGMQANCSQLCSLMEAAGEAISPMPLLENSLVVELLSACPESSIRDAAITEASLGQLAFGVQQLMCVKLPVLTSKAVASGPWTLSGNILLDFKPEKATSVLVLARMEGEETTRRETALIHLPVDHASYSQGYAGRRLDGRTLLELTFESTSIPREALVAHGSTGHDAIKRALSMGRLMLCAEACGIARRVLEMTIEYLQNRLQFGQPLGKFQALQHRAADMLIGTTYARDHTWETVANICAYEAKVGPNTPWTSEMHRCVVKTKIEVMRNVTLVAKHAIQLYGGMGVSDELPISHAFRRMVVIEKLLGSRSYLLSKLAEVSNCGSTFA